MEFQLGETYSGYQFLDILKRSRNGIEYRVRNTFADRLELLRALPPSAHDDQERTERFLREMRVHACVAHPNIVTLFNAIELEHQLVMTTELVEGTTLAERLQLGPLAWGEAVALIHQALRAAAYAHTQKVVHRDINPDNIIITPEGVLKLSSFTLAKGLTSPKLTQVGVVMGNPKYISPEQIKGMADVDGRSDIYSLGIVLYEMLCGRPPFDSESQFELMAAQVNQPPTPPDEVNRAVPKDLAAVVLKAISKEPSQRYQTADEFDQALARASASAVDALPPVTSDATVPKDTVKLAIDPRQSEVAEALLPAGIDVQPAAGAAGMAARNGPQVAPSGVAPMPVAPASDASTPAGDTRRIPDSTMPPPIPGFLTSARRDSSPMRMLAVAGAAGGCLGVLVIALWLFVK